MQKPLNALPFEFFLIMSFKNPLSMALLGTMILIGFAYVGIAQHMGTRFNPASQAFSIVFLTPLFFACGKCLIHCISFHPPSQT